MPRVNFRFRDEEGNIVHMTNVKEIRLGGIIFRLICAGIVLKIIFVFLGILKAFFISLSLL